MSFADLSSIGGGSRVADNVRIGHGTRLEPGCRIESNVTIEEGIHLNSSSLIFESVQIKKGVRADFSVHYGAGSIIGENSRLGGGACVERLAVIPPGIVVPERGMEKF